MPPQELMAQPTPLILLSPEETLDTVTEKIVKNYSIYHQLAEQLKSLQEWAKKVREESLKNVNDRNQKN